MSGSEDGYKLWDAAGYGKVEELERLLRMGVNPDDYSWVRLTLVPSLAECAETPVAPVTTPNCNTISGH